MDVKAQAKDIENDRSELEDHPKLFIVDQGDGASPLRLYPDLPARLSSRILAGSNKA
jgi:hypothetical protein